MPILRTILATTIALTIASCTSAPPTPDYLTEGKAKGYAAATAAQTAVTPEQWEDVADGWQRAIDQLDSVPRDNPDYAEAQAKRDEYFNNKLAALKNKSQGQLTAIDLFNQWLTETDPTRAIVTSAALDPEDGEIVIATVTPAFLAQNETVKLEAARGLQQKWAALTSPTEPDRAHLWLRSPSGAKVGGSRPMAATSIYLE